LNISQFISKF